MKSLLAAIVVVLMAGAAQAQQPGGCQYQGATLPSGAGGTQYLSTRLTAPQNGRCAHAVSGPAGTVEVVRQPRNGRAEASSGGIVYTPNPGFTGSDEYVFAARAPAGRVQVTVSVDVR